MKNLTTINNGIPKPGYNAIYRAATDPRIGWTECNFVVKKVIVLVTDCLCQLGQDKKYTKEPLGDGTDTCHETRHPRMPEVNKFLSNKNIDLFFVFLEDKDNIGDIYKHLAKQLSIHTSSIICKESNPSVLYAFRKFLKRVQEIDQCKVCGIK